ncbi:predicted protein [Plenodomus lingam JN3]|uniref:Predicted protein n=1 Tax=Leptosphaeria maculans (strain JN3 / isolate v23.1.3 / race Av1-4-5-6-7-8) TaxID=985895 RepID=E4ZIT6_LEPMJ|nr:predicted protein [Plenodomus lingam JN3]CBX91107.1 predicted protein [Plenodomus lingam JN3]
MLKNTTLIALPSYLTTKENNSSPRLSFESMEPPRHPLADITSEVETTTSSQTANFSPTSSQSYPENSSNSPKSRLPVHKPIKVIVGADPVSQRTWYLPEALLTHHSTLAASLLNSRPDSILTWPNVDARDFANFATPQ